MSDLLLLVFLLLVVTSSFSMAAAASGEEPVECGVSSYNPPHPAMKATFKTAAERRLQVFLLATVIILSFLLIVCQNYTRGNPIHKKLKK
jgi:hypothetical protein